MVRKSANLEPNSLSLVGGRRINMAIWQVYVVFWVFLSAGLIMKDARGEKGERLTLDYTIVEEEQNRLRIGRVGEDAMLDRKYSGDVYRSLRYSFLRQDPKITQLFDVNSVTGMLSTKTSIDREAFCEGPVNDCVLTFDVAARPMPVRFLEVIVVRIHIQDLNDNRPQFPSRSFEVPISESVLPGVKLVLPQAQDPDSAPNGVRHYELLSSTPKFDLSVKNMSDGSKELRLVVKDHLDREAMDRYSLQLVAWDGGSPPLSGTLDIDVKVLDANDNNPVFDNSTYDMTAREDTAVRSVILRVHASDKDTGPNAEVTYSLTAETKKKFGSVFGIKNRSGEIYLKGPLDYESEKIYVLTVEARDGGWESVPARARVNVHVVDVNDHPPVITVNSLTPNRQVQIPENSEPDTFVTHLSVEDADSGPNGEVTCFLQDYAVHLFAIQQIYTNEYTISTIGASFDRERQPMHRLTVVCEDHGSPSLQSTKQIDVRLLDLNDHSPQFRREVYSLSVRENNTLYTPLLTVNATDLDEGENGRVTYRLHPESDPLVKINPNTGLISTNALLDYEKMHQFQFRVIATDNGDPKRSATATVVLNLVDINDEAPVFHETSVDFGTYENERPGTEIGSVRAIDPDSPPYNVVRYTQQAQRSAKNTFVVDPETGVITTRRTLDREYQASYTFVVLAGNPGFPLTTSSVTVTVYVLDVNDNAPTIQFPSPVNNTVQVPYLATKRYVITRVLAYDSDFSANAKLSYSIAKGNDDGLFEIDERNGALMVAVQTLQPKELFFKLLVMVTDMGVPQQTSVAELNIVVNKTATMVAHRKSHGKSSVGATNNLTIVIALGAATLVLIIVLVLAIILIKRNQRRRGNPTKNAANDVYRYTRRVDLASRAAAASPKHPPLATQQPDHHHNQPPPTNINCGNSVVGGGRVGGGGGGPGYKDDCPPDGMPSPDTPEEKRLCVGATNVGNGGGMGINNLHNNIKGGVGGVGGGGVGGPQHHMMGSVQDPRHPHHPSVVSSRTLDSLNNTPLGGGAGAGGGHAGSHDHNNPNQNAQMAALSRSRSATSGSGDLDLQAAKSYTTYRDPRDPHPGGGGATAGGPHHHQGVECRRHRILYDPIQGTISKHTRLTEKDLEMHQLVHMLMRDGRTPAGGPTPHHIGGPGGGDSDSVSGCSADMSNTDSGRGPSEDGDQHSRHCSMDPSSADQQPPPYDALWEDKRKSGGSGELRPVPEESAGPGRRAPPSDINNIIPPYPIGTSTFSPTHRDLTSGANTLTYGAGRRFQPHPAGGAKTQPPPPTRRMAPPGSSVLTPGSARTLPADPLRCNKGGVGVGVVPCGRHLGTGTSPRSSPQGSRDNLHHDSINSSSHSSPASTPINNKDLSAGTTTLTIQNGPKLQNHHNRLNSSSNKAASLGGANKGGDDTSAGEVIYVNTFGRRIPLHPLGRVEETQDEGSDDGSGTGSSTSGSFEVDQGDRCSANSIQTVINAAGQMDTVV